LARTGNWAISQKKPNASQVGQKRGSKKRRWNYGNFDLSKGKLSLAVWRGKGL